MIKDKTQNKKVITPSDENNADQKKGSVLQDEDNKEEKYNSTEEWE